MFRFVIGIADAFYVWRNFFGFGGCHHFGIWKSFEERGRGKINPFISALCREDDGNNEFKMIGVFQLSLRIGHVGAEVVKYLFVTFFFCHVHKDRKEKNFYYLA